MISPLPYVSPYEEVELPFALLPFGKNQKRTVTEVITARNI